MMCTFLAPTDDIVPKTRCCRNQNYGISDTLSRLVKTPIIKSDFFPHTFMGWNVCPVSIISSAIVLDVGIVLVRFCESQGLAFTSDPPVEVLSIWLFTRRFVYDRSWCEIVIFAFISKLFSFRTLVASEPNLLSFKHIFLIGHYVKLDQLQKLEFRCKRLVYS